MIVDPEIFSILIFFKEPRTSFSTTFCVLFFKKNICYILLTDLDCLVASTSGDIGQHAYCNYLLSNL